MGLTNKKVKEVRIRQLDRREGVTDGLRPEREGKSLMSISEEGLGRGSTLIVEGIGVV